MTTQNDIYEDHEEIVIGLQKQNSHLKWIVGILSGIIIILIILLIILGSKISDLKLDNDFLKSQLERRNEFVNSLEIENETLRGINETLIARLDTLEKRMSNLESSIKDFEKTIYSPLRKENLNLRKQIYNLMLKVDSLKNIPSREILIDTCIMDTTVYSKTLEVSIAKKTFDKKGNVLSTTSILDHNAPVYYTSKGFANDTLIWGCDYYNEDNEEIELTLNSVFNGKNTSLNFIEKYSNTGAEKVLLKKNTEVIVGAGGLLATKYGKPIETGFVYKFYELNFDEKKFKRGTWECIVGPILGAAGGFGIGYYATNPTVTVKVYQGDKLIGEDKTYNIPMLITSGVGALGGIGLTIKGCLDKKFSWSITPAELSLKYNINSK